MKRILVLVLSLALTLVLLFVLSRIYPQILLSPQLVFAITAGVVVWGFLAFGFAVLLKLF